MKKLNITRKRSSPQKLQVNLQEYKKRRKDSADLFVKYLDQGYNFIYIDESSFNLNIISNYGYSKKGKKFRVIEYPKLENMSLIATISNTELVGFMIFEGSVKSDDFGSFLLDLINNNSSIKDNLKKTVFYFDNGPTHKGNVLNDMLSEVNYMRGPSYSPFLNPIEGIFGIWKHLVRKCGFKSQISLIDTIIETSKKINKKHTLNMVLNSLKYWLQAYSLQDIE